ncbi:MAG: GDSL-type esterase/lipase family protein [Candidatus Saccharimonadales bacterium]
MNRIGVWGDSITWGASDLELGGWVSRLRIHLDNNFEDGPSVYNVGIGGDKVSDVMKRFDVEYEARKPETIILAIGINDSPHDSNPKGTPLDLFEQRFNELVSKIKEVSGKLIIIGLTNVDNEHPDDHGYSDETVGPYAEVVQKVATQKQLPYVDLWGVITKDDLKRDGLHPEEAGHEKIFQKIKATLLKELDL